MKSYLLASSEGERARLRLQSLVWEPDAIAILDEIPIRPGVSCIDVGCGAMGALRALSRAVGPSGRVVGVDSDRTLVDAARHFVEENALENVEVRQADLFEGDIREEFDVVHLRFLFAPIGRDADLLRHALALCKPGGVLIVQEPDAGSWGLLPPQPCFARLKDVILDAFRRGGGDFNAGQRTYGLLQGAGLEDVQIRAAVHALPPKHPYLRVALQFAASLRERIVGAGVLTAEHLDALVAEVEEVMGREDVAGLTFTVTQVWGRKPD